MSRWDEYVDAGAGAVNLQDQGFEPGPGGGAVYGHDHLEVSSLTRTRWTLNRSNWSGPDRHGLRSWLWIQLITND